jgi:hypothetical protein
MAEDSEARGSSSYAGDRAKFVFLAQPFGRAGVSSLVRVRAT